MDNQIDQLVSYETALLANEKGFSIICRYFTKDGSTICDIINNNTLIENEFAPFIEIPTQSLLQRWLREDHNIDILIDNHGGYGSKNRYQIFVKDWIYSGFNEPWYSEKYEDALEYALKIALTFI